MKKTDISPDRRSFSEIRKVIPAIAKVNKANMKVNKANAQSAAGGFHLRRQMASCVLSTSKHFQCLKTTCPFCFMQGEKRAPKSAFFDNSSDVGQSCLDRQRCGGFLENRQKRFS